jgi:hypothetical protein
MNTSIRASLCTALLLGLAGAAQATPRAHEERVAAPKREPAREAPSQRPAGPKSGQVCATPGQTHRGTDGVRLDCVAAGGAHQWHRRGSQLNPFALNEVGLIVTEHAQWRIALEGIEPDVTDRVLAADSRNKPPKAGARFVGVRVALTYVGKNGDEMVRQGAMLKVVEAGSQARIERWSDGALTEDDCWTNERVGRNESKRCMMPFEVRGADVSKLKVVAVNWSGVPVAWFAAQ